ncbi:hypothetical protein [Caldimonas sp. KR1-144]|uniref:hypothetical protein n=1 Tax=Caldimonas sp. KR1-144 TaxID=3400911 RepID=UPI003BFAF791
MQPPEPPFEKCHCGGTVLKRVKVARPDGSLYSTEFGACSQCGAMFHKPQAYREVSDKGTPSATQGFATAYIQPAGESTVTEEQMREIREAVERVNKSKGKRSSR